MYCVTTWLSSCLGVAPACSSWTVFNQTIANSNQQLKTLNLHKIIAHSSYEAADYFLPDLPEEEWKAQSSDSLACLLKEIVGSFGLFLRADDLKQQPSSTKSVCDFPVLFNNIGQIASLPCLGCKEDKVSQRY